VVTAADVLWWAETIYMYLPAYIANATPVVLGGGTPLDGGRRWIDGEPILGDHKTVRGTVSGLAVGILIGVLQLEPLRGALLSVGTICGDLFVSFVKRRLRLKPGAMFPVADQMGFIVFAVALVSLVEPPTWERVAAILVATLPIHLLTNVVAWLLGLKSDPW
jgi:CDP-2,3-bis-(O-geranylgeranyl)-sn-glycerol synthase